MLCVLGMVVGKMPGGGDLVVGGGDGGSVPPEVLADKNPKGTVMTEDLPGTGLSGGDPPGVGEVGFGNNAAPPAYGSTVGEPMGTQGMQGQGMDPFAKR